jgi:hypothetical protein
LRASGGSGPELRPVTALSPAKGAVRGRLN